MQSSTAHEITSTSHITLEGQGCDTAFVLSGESSSDDSENENGFAHITVRALHML